MKNKESKAKFLVICSSLLFLLLLIAEFYAAVNDPDNYALIIVFAILCLVGLFAIIYGILLLREQKELRREEQYESIFKSEKASYLLLKKYFEDIEEKIERLEQSAKIPTEEIINAQKGIAKVIINRNRENAEALLNSNDQLMENMSDVMDKIDNNNQVLLMEQKHMSGDNLRDYMDKQQELLMNLKDMELRLNGAIMQCQKSVSQTPISVMPTVMPQNVSMPVMEQPVKETVMDEPVIEDSFIEKADLEEPVIEDAFIDEEPLMDEALIEEPVAEEPAVEESVVEESESEEPVNEEELASLLDDILGDSATDNVVETKEDVVEDGLLEDSILEEPSDIKIDEEPIVEPVQEVPPMPDLSDPNAKMSPDEIAALIANMGAGNDPQPVVEPEPEPVQEEIPPMPDLSDPNKVMSPDEIAALIANM